MTEVETLCTAGYVVTLAFPVLVFVVAGILRLRHRSDRPAIPAEA